MASLMTVAVRLMGFATSAEDRGPAATGAGRRPSRARRADALELARFVAHCPTDRPHLLCLGLELFVVSRLPAASSGPGGAWAGPTAVWVRVLTAVVARPCRERGPAAGAGGGEERISGVACAGESRVRAESRARVLALAGLVKLLVGSDAALEVEWCRRGGSRVLLYGKPRRISRRIPHCTSRHTVPPPYLVAAS